MAYFLLYSSFNYIPFLALRQVNRTAGVDFQYQIYPGGAVEKLTHWLEERH